LRRIVKYAGVSVLALIGAFVLLAFVVGFVEGVFSSSSGGGPGNPSSAGVVDYDPAWSPDSRAIAFDRGDYGNPDDKRSGASDVFVARADGTQLRRLTRTPYDETMQGWLANPLRVVYSTYQPKQPTRIYALNVKGGARVELGELEKTDQLLALSHDARRALVGTPWINPTRYALVDLARKTRRLLPGSSGGSYRILADGAWSGHDSMLAYVTLDNIVIMRGKRVLRRVPLGMYDSASGGLAWSPDGRWLAYGDGGDNSSLWLVRINDGKRSRLTGGGETSDQYPVWSPDGSSIYYEHSSRGDHDGLRAIAPDGTGDRKITSDDWAGGGLLNWEGKNDRWLDTITFSPDGTKIAYLLGQRGAWKNWSLLGVMNADGTDKTPFSGSL
jgi:Tol biopolymer transport system component